MVEIVVMVSHTEDTIDMKPVAFTYDWGLTTDISRLNASIMCGKLGVEHIIRSADISKKENM